MRSWEGEVTLEAIAHSGSHKHTETHNPGHIRERIKLFYSSNKTGNSAKETLDSRLLMQTVQTATLVNKEWFFAFVKHHLTGCIVSNVGTHNLKHYYLLCIYRCVFSVFWATVHWLQDFLPSYRLLESFVLYLALMKCGIQSFAIRLWSLASVSKSSSQIGYQVHDFSEFSVPRYSESRIITKLPPEVLPDPLRCELRVYLSPARTALSPLPLIDAASLVTSPAL